jgi:hypothetical protein
LGFIREIRPGCWVSQYPQSTARPHAELAAIGDRPLSLAVLGALPNLTAVVKEALIGPTGEVSRAEPASYLPAKGTGPARFNTQKAEPAARWTTDTFRPSACCSGM